MIVGLDIDNTIICYDDLLHDLACEAGFIDKTFPAGKTVIRDHVRKAHGDIAWQHLQVELYGYSIEKARLSEGVWNFLLKLKEQGIPFQLVSHKTKYPNCGIAQVDLRKAALGFLEKKNFFASSGAGLSVSDVFFLSTREDKVRKISSLNHSVFIDDLEEVFIEPDFPEHTVKILYSPDDKQMTQSGCSVFNSFDRISSYFFREIAHD